jgi:hypothetical protein
MRNRASIQKDNPGYYFSSITDESIVNQSQPIPNNAIYRSKPGTHHGNMKHHVVENSLGNLLGASIMNATLNSTNKQNNFFLAKDHLK